MLSRYDASHFPHWPPLAGNRVDWRLFTDGQRSLRVGDVNATKLERILGVDLIYRHLESDTFVLVQYKKMRRDAHGKWSYRPDAQLDAELERMRKVDTTAVEAAADPATWRLNPRGCFLKLVRPPEFFDPTSDRLLNGIYLPLLYLVELFAAHPEGTRPHLGYDTIDRYITAELFVALVLQGWIGTRGVTTRAIQKLVDAAVGAQHSVIIAEETGQQPGRTAAATAGRASYERPTAEFRPRRSATPHSARATRPGSNTPARRSRNGSCTWLARLYDVAGCNASS